MDSPFHLGEQQIQSRLGMRDKLEDIGRRMIRDHMPEQHREFFALLPWLLVGSRDADGQPQASVLWGAPGFATSPQPQRLRIDSLPEADDPLAANLRAGTGLGLLGIELPTRRRNRMNGRVEALSDGGFAVAVQQSFGNCPKYIQVRSWQTATRQPGQLEQGEGPDPRWLPLVEGSDTLFIASSNGADMDISHRGGPRGFVRLARDGRLWLPDYSGNLAATMPIVADRVVTGLMREQDGFSVISEGTSSDMESYAERIDAAGIWDLVNYIRTLRPKP